jgi:hypothetical protein
MTTMWTPAPKRFGFYGTQDGWISTPRGMSWTRTITPMPAWCDARIRMLSRHRVAGLLNWRDKEAS